MDRSRARNTGGDDAVKATTPRFRFSYYGYQELDDFPPEAMYAVSNTPQLIDLSAQEVASLGAANN